MKFGEHLRKALIKNYSFYYIAYDDLKHQLKKDYTTMMAFGTMIWKNCSLMH